jgi:predicted CXXCH cytochrome family protein
MKKRASDGPPLKRLALLLLLGAAVIVALQYPIVPTKAQGQGGTAQTPTGPAVSSPTTQSEETAAAPAAQPETPQVKPAQPAAASEPSKTGPAAPPQPKPEANESQGEASSSKSEELSTQSCLECHNPDILKLSKEELAEQVVAGGEAMPPRRKAVFRTGEMNLSIKDKAYAAGVHADTTCVTCHKDVVELPHQQRLKVVDCKECHEESVDTMKAGAHGDKAGPKAPACVDCHDVHYGKAVSAYTKDFQSKLCIDCHKAYGMDTAKAHGNLYESGLHLKMDCMTCHQGRTKGVHNILPVKTKVARCEACHTKYTMLSKEKKLPTRSFAYMRITGFINSDALDKFGYMVGAHRIPALDMILVLVVLGTFGLPIAHGGLRILTRRKGPIHLPEEKILLHPLTERIWHWFQALCIVMLVITGIMLHWPEHFPGWFPWAVTLHNWFGMGAVVAFLVWLVYNFVTGRISHYIPKKGEIPHGLIRQAQFYGYGIFKHEPHPYAPSEDNKFNPLQKIAYLQFQLLLLPILLLTGVLYMFPGSFEGIIAAIGGMAVLGTIHLMLGALFAAFLVAHLYLATTGETVSENFKAIITGYGIKEEHGEHKEHNERE